MTWSGHSHHAGFSGYSKNPATECHWGNILVFTTHDGIEVHAGGSSRGGGWWKMDELPDLAMGPDNEVKRGYNQLKCDTATKNMEGWRVNALFEEKEPPAVIEMDFPDYSVPRDCKKIFWETLVEDIREQGVKSIHVMCMGGHGRTGVQLACLRWHLATEEERKEWPDAYTLVMDIREPYCDHAVEADSQQAYVAAMCGIPIGEALPFHKGIVSYTSKTTTTTSSGSNSGAYADLLECNECDLIMFEDNTVNDIKEGDPCYDHCCNGTMKDITDEAIVRTNYKEAEVGEYALNLTNLDVCSSIGITKVGELSEDRMEELHGVDWQKTLDRKMNRYAKSTVRGLLLRNLNTALSNLDKDAHPILVVIDDALTDERVCGNAIPTSRAWTKCGFCESKTSPDRLTLAYRTNKNEQEAAPCCPKCVISSGLEFQDFIEWESDEETGVVQLLDKENKVLPQKYNILHGLSPVRAMRVRDLRENKKEQTVKVESWEDWDDDDDPWMGLGI